jgi:hypothetical protein
MNKSNAHVRFLLQFGAVVDYARLFAHDNASVAFLVGRAQIVLGEYQKVECLYCLRATLLTYFLLQARASFLVASRAFANHATALDLWALVQPNENTDEATGPNLGAFYAHVGGMRLFLMRVLC